MGNTELFIGGVGSDIFGEVAAARLPHNDYVNDTLRTRYLREYLQWHIKNQKLSPTFARDLQYVKYYDILKVTNFLIGVAFAAIVINPNYTRRRSYYIKKFNCLVLGICGTQYAVTR